MTEEAKRSAEALRHVGVGLVENTLDCSACPMQDVPVAELDCGSACPETLMALAADLIEKLIAQLEEERANYQQMAECAMRLVDGLNESLDRESGLHIMLTSAQSAAETWERKYKEVLSKLGTTTRERDAAVGDLNYAIEHSEGIDFCTYCKHNEEDGQCHHPCNAYAGVSGWGWRGRKEVRQHGKRTEMDC